MYANCINWRGTSMFRYGMNWLRRAVLKTWWAKIQQLVLSENNVLYLFWEHDNFSRSCHSYRVVTPASLRPYIYLSGVT